MTEDREQFLREEQAKQDRLLALLAEAPLRDLAGLVHPSGVRGTQSQGQQDCIFVLPLIVWRFEDEPLRHTPLRLEQAVQHLHLAKRRKAMPPFHIVHVRARVALETEYGAPRGIMDRFIPPFGDTSDLAAAADAFREPYILLDPVLGELVLDRSLGWLCTKAQWNGVEITINLTGDYPANCAKQLEVAHALMNDQSGWEARARDKIVQEYLHLKNDGWLDEGQSPLSAEEFRRTPIVESINIDVDGKFEFWFTDGDLFWGHVLTVTGDLARGITHALLQG